MKVRQRNILIVEDESITSLNIEYILNEIGHRILGNCQTAEQIFYTLRNNEVDLVLMDVRLNGDVDGIEVAELIRKEFDIPIVFLTAYYSPELFQRAKSTYPYAYILKPFTSRELAINIELVLSRNDSEKQIRSMHAMLQKTNSELERKIQARTLELEIINTALREEIQIGKKKSEALEQSEKDYRELFENAQDAILILDPVTEKINKVNKTAREMYGYTDEEFQRITIEDLSFKTHEYADYLEMIEANGGRFLFESVHRKSNGQLMYVEIIICAIQYNNNLAFQYLVRDVTQRKNAEQALTNSEKRYRDMTNFLPIPIFETDKEGFITYCNLTAHTLFGYDSDEMIDKVNLFDLVVPDERDKIRQMAFKKPSGPGEEGITYTAVKKNGARMEVIGYSVTFYRENIVQGLRTCLIDIGDLTKMQAQLLKFSMVIEQINEAVMIADKSGKIEYVNPAFLEEYGYSRDEVIGRRPSFLKSGQHEDSFYEKLWKEISSGKIFSAEFINLKKNGEFYFEEKTITPLRDTTGTISHYVSTGKNILEKKNAERKIFEHQRFIDAINNTVPLIVFVFDITRIKFTFVNNKIISILGYQPEEFLGFTSTQFINLVHINDRKTLPFIVGRENYVEDNVNQVVLKVLHKSGGYRIIQFRAVSFVRNEENEVEQIVGTALDITEQKYHEKQHNAMLRLHRLQEKKEQKLRTISLLQGQEEERKRMSRDMHDGIGQLMTAIKMKLDNLEKNVDPSAGEISQGISHANKIVRQAIVEVRRISNDLVPISLYDFGMPSVFRRLLESISDKKVSFSSNLGAARFPSTIELAFYRIFQETINNIQKHSQAESIDVILNLENDLLQMIIIDDGIGFSLPDRHAITLPEKGNGLNNMYERARIIGGKYFLQTAIGKGCQITLEVSVKPIAL